MKERDEGEITYTKVPTVPGTETKGAAKLLISAATQLPDP